MRAILIAAGVALGVAALVAGGWWTWNTYNTEDQLQAKIQLGEQLCRDRAKGDAAFYNACKEMVQTMARGNQ